jgi:hemolysin activation/secretion protein
MAGGGATSAALRNRPDRGVLQPMSRGPHRSLYAVSACAATAVFAVCQSILAQDADRTIPPAPPRDLQPATLPTVTSPVTTPQAVTDEQTVLIESLRGLVLTATPPASPATSGPATRPDREGGVVVEIESLKERAGLLADLNTRIGRPLTMGELNAVCGRIIEEFRAMGRPVVDTIIPEQDITDGVIRIVIVQARLGEVRVENAPSTLVARRTAGEVRLERGSVIESQTLLEDLAWLNRKNPFRRYQILFEKGEEAGTSDVVLRADGPTYPIRVFGAFDNSGSPGTGEERILAGFNWGDALGLGLDHQLSYQFTRDDAFRRFQAHGLTYTVPLPWRHLISAQGTWSRSSPDFEDARIDSVGESWQLSGRYEIPLRRREILGRPVEQSVVFGVDFKRSNNNLEFGGESVYDRAAETLQFLAEYRLQRADPSGLTSAQIALYVSPGEVTSHNDESAYDLARAGAEPQYAYVSAGLDRHWRLTGGSTLSARAASQASTGPLLSSEQFGIGGADTVRGYNERELNTDTGLLGSIEWQSPGVRPLSWVGASNIQDDLRLYAFVDAGVGWNFQSDDTNPATVYAISVGPGVRYQLGDFGSLDASYGVRVDDRGVSDNDDGRAHFRVSASFSW